LFVYDELVKILAKAERQLPEQRGSYQISGSKYQRREAVAKLKIHIIDS